MNTDKLMKWAEQIISGLYDGPQGQVEGLMCAQVYALLAIANELKRTNDRTGDTMYGKDGNPLAYEVSRIADYLAK